MGPMHLMVLFSLLIINSSLAKVCPGCPRNANAKDPSVYEYLSDKLKHLKNNVPEGMENEDEAELVRVKNVQEQVVNGIRYSYEFEARGLTTNKLYVCDLVVVKQAWKEDEQVFKYICQEVSSSRNRRSLLGGEVALDVKNNEQLEKLKPFIGQEIGKKQGSKYFMRVTRYFNATKQVVAGMLIRATVEVAETNCNLNERSNDNHCFYQFQDRQVCDVQVWLKPWMKEQELTKVQCRPQNENLCAGCPVEADPNDIEIQQTVERTLSNHNAQSQSAEKLSLVKINKVTSQIISGVKYTVDFDAEDESSGKLYHCKAVIISKPWISKEPAVADFDCTPVTGN